MGYIFKKIAIYWLILTITSIIPFSGNWRNIFFLVVLGGILLDIGSSIPNERAEKKYFIYMGILIALGVLFNCLSIATYVDVHSDFTWQNLLAANAMLAIILVMLFEIARAVRNTHVGASYLLYSIAGIGGLGLALFNILIFIVNDWSESIHFRFGVWY